MLAGDLNREAAGGNASTRAHVPAGERRASPDRMTVATLSLTRSRDQLELAVDGAKVRAPFAKADVDTLSAIISDYQAAIVDDLAAELPILGGRLFAWLDSKGGWLTGLLEGCHAPLRLEIMSPGRPKREHRALIEAPWELLFEDGFLAEDATARYTPVRLVGERGPQRGPRSGALSVLFMAAAPRGVTELAFEEEEARILARTADMGLDLFVEDTGTARELGLRAALLGADAAHALHVIHISCHGNNVPEPLLVFEDEFGEAADTPVASLCDALGTRTVAELGLLFSSACLTAAGGGFTTRHSGSP